MVASPCQELPAGKPAQGFGSVQFSATGIGDFSLICRTSAAKLPGILLLVAIQVKRFNLGPNKALDVPKRNTNYKPGYS